MNSPDNFLDKHRGAADNGCIVIINEKTAKLATTPNLTTIGPNIL